MNPTTFVRSKSAQTVICAALIFGVTLAIFSISRVRQVADSQYSMMVSQSLLDHRSFTLDEYALPRHQPVWHGYYFKNGPIYQLEVVQNHFYYHFPPGTSVLSTPVVAALNVFGVSAVNADGSYNPRGEVMIEAGLAALLMAVLAVVFFFVARLLLPVRWSIVVALGGSLGTQVYSTASRALWSETWGIFLLGFVILMLLADETGRRTIHPVVLATVLSWMCFVRPTFAVPIAAISVYLFLCYRQLLIRYALTGVVWLAVFIGYSWFHFGQILPSYYRARRFGLATFWTALAGNLISPSRGLLVYVPILVFVVFLLLWYWKYIRYRRLVWLSASVVVGHLILISGFPHWWGGHSFGPRFTTGLVPWFVLLGTLGLDAMLRWRLTSISELRTRNSQWIWRAQISLAGLLLICSLFINALGATSHATWLWNQRPKGVDENPERLWDWRQPQFLAKYLPYPPPDEYPVLLEAPIDFSKPESAKFLWYGWSQAEDGVWAENDAALVFSVSDKKPVALRLTMSAFLAPGTLDSQPVTISLNQKPLTTFTAKASGPMTYSLEIPSGSLQSENLLRLQMSNAASPQRLGAGEDPRLRSLKLHSLQVEVLSQ